MITAQTVTAEVTVDQVEAIAFRLIDAQVNQLLEDGFPPDKIITNLLDIAATLLSKLDPVTARIKATTDLSERFKKVVLAKARERTLSHIVRPNGRMNS